MPKVQAGDIMMHYEVYGDGPPLVLLHGLGYQRAFWWLQIEVVAQHYRVSVPDNRGADDTDAPNEPYTTAMMANLISKNNTPTSILP